ncbi:MAG TPA: folylpolyglutamate synthase/dihydrofolate synthase family protein [Planctomycetota bacterium]|jgi:dihydrofolate synthase/folylpolyglutamate synthase
MDYTQALEYLDGFVNFERTAPTRATRTKISLDRVRELAARLGNPQDTFPTLHVAGTKGKGSTCAFAQAILSAAGLKAGLYTSPHLQDVRERIQLGSQMIPQEDFARLLSDCVPTLEIMRHPPKGERRPTYFEVLTHLAFSWFAEQKVDVAVVEVGLGGRLDATNIIRPVACAITNISLDHQAILGDTLREIAREKAGILKPGAPVVVAPQLPDVAAAIEECARAADTRLDRIGTELTLKVSNAAPDNGWHGPDAELSAPEGETYRAKLGLRGTHQAENWALAVRLSDIFYRKKFDLPLPQAAVAEGSEKVHWPGRLEELPQQAGPRIFLDGAHNDHSLRTVLRELRSGLGAKRELTVVFGCAKDKDLGAMLNVLHDERINDVLFTHSGNSRARDPESMAAEWRRLTHQQALVSPSCIEALDDARRVAGKHAAVLVTGSLYLVGAVKVALEARRKK